MSSASNYLKAERLSDVLSLIQVLAFDRNTSRSEEGLRDELQRKPTSNTWVDIAKEHPEFFRVRSETDRTIRVSLIARYVSEYVLTEDGDEKRPPLDATWTNKLMELAIELHDKQYERANLWKSWLPLIIALISAFATIFIAIFKGAGS